MSDNNGKRNGNGVERNEAVNNALAALGGTGAVKLESHHDIARGFKRSVLTADVRNAIEQFPDEMRAELMDDAKYVAPFLKALSAGLERGERTCLTIYSQAMKLVGEDRQLSVQVVNLVGAPAEVAKASVDAMERAKSLSPRQRQEAMARSLREAGWRVNEPDNWSVAEVET